eukprot:363414-Chlamydomonas_euryale.AAC.6
MATRSDRGACSCCAYPVSCRAMACRGRRRRRRRPRHAPSPTGTARDASPPRLPAIPGATKRINLALARRTCKRATERTAAAWLAQPAFSGPSGPTPPCPRLVPSCPPPGPPKATEPHPDHAMHLPRLRVRPDRMRHAAPACALGCNAKVRAEQPRAHGQAGSALDLAGFFWGGRSGGPRPPPPQPTPMHGCWTRTAGGCRAATVP